MCIGKSGDATENRLELSAEPSKPSNWEEWGGLVPLMWKPHIRYFLTIWPDFLCRLIMLIKHLHIFFLTKHPLIQLTVHFLTLLCESVHVCRGREQLPSSHPPRDFWRTKLRPLACTAH